MALDSSEKDEKNIQGDVSSDEEVSEGASLLPQKREISPEPTTLGFGEMSESAGVWYRDTSGKHLTRFVVLHMFLIFSMLMVGSKGYVTFCILCVQYYDCTCLSKSNYRVY